MRKLLALISNIKIKTNLTIVLSVFFVMLVSGAVLGVGGMFLNNKALAQIMLTQDIRAALVDTINSYNRTQVTMGRATVVAVIDEGLNNQSETLIAEAKKQHQNTKDEFSRFRDLVQDFDDEEGIYQRVIDSFDTVIMGGVDPLFGMLESGQLTTYQSYLDGTTVYLEEDFLSTVLQLAKTQQELINQISAQQTAQYKLIQILVGVGILSAMIVCLLAYWFLGYVVLRPLRNTSQIFDRMAGGDMTETIQVTSNNEIGNLMKSLRRMQDSLTRVVSQVRYGVNEITVGSKEISMGNTDLSSRTAQQAASLQQTAASMEQLDSTVKQNTDNANQANEMAANASDVVQRGGEAVTSVVSVMQEISESSNKMSEIVGVIDSIAFQTNILALNAAVEAARAGEQGRGFAVVAGEVRSLAQRSAQAASEIKDLIDASVSKVQLGAGRADEAGNVMQEVVESISRVTTIMAEIASASREQADGIGQVNIAVTEMDGVVQQNAALVQQAAAAASSLESQAQRLSTAVAFFNLNEADIIDIQASEQQLLSSDYADEDNNDYDEFDNSDGFEDFDDENDDSESSHK